MEIEGYKYKKAKIESALKENNISSLEEAREICLKHNIDVEKFVKDIQPICFDNACWAYTVGAAVAIKRGLNKAYEVAKCLGEGSYPYSD